MRSISWGSGSLSSVLVTLLVVGGCQVNFGEWPEDAGGDAGSDADGVDPCEGVSCGDHGSCHVLDGEPTCVCETAYDGDECDSCYAGYHDEDGVCTLDHECLPTSCAGHGECNDEGGEVTCECDTGFNAETHCAECTETYHRIGEACVENESCDDMECEHGSCAEEDGVARCECRRGYSGEHCSDCADGFSRNDEECVLEESCGDRECSGHGTCQERDGGAWCECQEGYQGFDCDECSEGYHRDGEDCEPNAPCDDTTCPEHYDCVDEEDGSTSCVCSEGYGGEDCLLCLEGFHHEDDDCVRNISCGDIVCVHGTCEEFADGSSRCVCHTGYVSDDCSDCADGYHEGVDDRCEPNETCDDFPCPEHATCTVLGGVASCMCDPGYEGEGCDTCSVGYNDHGDGECVPAYCGDGITDPGEDCDDGNEINTDACLSTCREANCGDGFVCSAEDCDPVERCDDGNTEYGDACAGDCLDGERIIETIAGGGVCDGLPARAVNYDAGYSGIIYVDGFVYFSDLYHDRIRRFSLDNPIVETVAGTGVGGFNSDGPALRTQLNSPSDLALGPDDEIYILDWNNMRVRRLTRDGDIVTLFGGAFPDCRLPLESVSMGAGSVGLCDPYGIEVNSDGDVLVAEMWSGILIRYDASEHTVERVAGTGSIGTGTVGQPANMTPSTQVWNGAWLADGRIVFTELYHNRVRVVNHSGLLGTIASIPRPEGLVAYRDGFLVSSSTHGRGVTFYSPSVGTSIVAGGSDNPDDGVRATESHFPDGGGPIFVYEDDVFVGVNFRIRRFEIGDTIETIAGNGYRSYCGDIGTADGLGVAEPDEGWNYSAINASLNSPVHVVTLDDGTVVWTERARNVVRMMLPDGTIDTLAGSGQRGQIDGVGILARFCEPYGLAVDIDGTILVAETNGCDRVRRIDPVTREVTTIAGRGTAGPPDEGDLALDASLGQLLDIAIGSDGTIYLAEHDHNRVSRIDGDNRIWTYAGAFDSRGNSGDGGAATSARLGHPVSLGIDSEGNLYVGDYWYDRVRVIRPGDRPGTATIEAFAGNEDMTSHIGDGGSPDEAGMPDPSDIAVDSFTGSVYISDRVLNVVRVVRDEDPSDTVNLVIRTVAGTGSCDYDGDREPATASSLCSPTGLAVADNGGIYIADTKNHRIRYVSFPEMR